jgi:hypothetical protein
MVDSKQSNLKFKVKKDNKPERRISFGFGLGDIFGSKEEKGKPTEPEKGYTYTLQLQINII